MAAVMGVDHVVNAQGIADTYRNAFLSDAEMRRGAHFLFFIQFSEGFLDVAHTQHVAVEADFEIRRQCARARRVRYFECRYGTHV